MQYAELLTSLDGFISGMRTVRFHLTEHIKTKTDKYRLRVCALIRHLDLNVTPKVHLIEDHAIYFLGLHQGFGDLGEDAGERAHQIESKHDQRMAGVRDFKRKEALKSKHESRLFDPRVKIKIEEIKQKGKRKFDDSRVVTAVQNRELKQRKIQDRREHILLLPPVPPVKMTTLRERRNLLFHTTN